MVGVSRKARAAYPWPAPEPRCNLFAVFAVHPVQ